MSITLSIIYLIATVTFVIGLKFLGHPETAKKGNFISATGMILAIIGTLFLHGFENVPLINWSCPPCWNNNWLVNCNES